LAGKLQCHSRNIQDIDVLETCSNQVIHQSGCAAPNVDDMVCFSNTCLLNILQ
jgi:hypothetical protein